MGKIVQIPGLGDYEFPDSMESDEIANIVYGLRGMTPPRAQQAMTPQQAAPPEPQGVVIGRTPAPRWGWEFPDPDVPDVSNWASALAAALRKRTEE